MTVPDLSAVSWQNEPAVAVSTASFMSVTRIRRIRWTIFLARSTPGPQTRKTWRGPAFAAMHGREATSVQSIRKLDSSWRCFIRDGTAGLTSGHTIEPITPIGKVTVRLLRLNSDQRVAERRALAR